MARLSNTLLCKHKNFWVNKNHKLYIITIIYIENAQNWYTFHQSRFDTDVAWMWANTLTED